MGLAEPKRRIKYSIDPNAQHWAKNESKFGARLMRKMGWEDGKGLGANEDGMTEHIKVKFKSDTKGVGYNNNDYENVWMGHQDDFESLLKNLKTNNDDEKGEASKSSASDSSNEESVSAKTLNLENKFNEVTKRHVRHNRIIRAKNLSKATSHDLDCILGTKKRKQLKAEAAQNDSPEPAKAVKRNDDSESELDMRPSFKLNDAISDLKPKENKSSESSKLDSKLLFKTHTLSVGDYFKSKMRAKLGLSDVESLEKAADEEPEETKEDPDLESDTRKKSKKHKKHKKEKIQEEEEEIVVEESEVTEVVEESIKKKKKKKKSKDNEEEEQQQDNEIQKDESNDTKFFVGSNALDINGYSPYIIAESTDKIMSEKLKKVKAKKAIYEKNIKKDENFYNMNKKMAIATD